MKVKKRWILFFVLLISMATCSIPEITHKNNGVSESTGTVRNGKLKNGWLIPYQGDNFHYFSPFSYYILNNAYVHSTVHATVLDAYKICGHTCPDKEFVMMECTRRHGGRMIFHWTHQNGMSVDFMTPKKKGDYSQVWANKAGLLHYLFKFDEDGKFNLSSKIQIDFDTMARHLIALDDASKKHGLRIRKILFHTDLHDDLFGSPSGQLLVERNLNFIPHLNDLINGFHDDHYHVDFEIASGER